MVKRTPKKLVLDSLDSLRSSVSTLANENYYLEMRLKEEVSVAAAANRRMGDLRANNYSQASLIASMIAEKAALQKRLDNWNKAFELFAFSAKAVLRYDGYVVIECSLEAKKDLERCYAEYGCTAFDREEPVKPCPINGCSCKDDPHHKNGL